MTAPRQANDSNLSSGVSDSATQSRPKPSARLAPSPLRRSKMAIDKFVYHTKRSPKGGNLGPHEVLEMHRRVLDGELFLRRITTTLESNAAAKNLLLEPFASVSIKIGHKQITRALFAIVLLNPEDGEPALEVTTQGKSPEAAKLLGDLIRQVYLRMLEEESPTLPVLPEIAELALALNRKGAEIEVLRKQIQQRQSTKPVSSVQEITLRAELEQSEGELADAIEILSEIQRARDKGASVENLAALPALSAKGNLSEYSMVLKQLRKLRNSAKDRKVAIREELEHQFTQAERKLEGELLAVITDFKKRLAEAINRRNTARASLVELVKASSALHEDSPRFRLLKQREREVEILQNRYDVATTKWKKAKLLLQTDPESP